MIRRVSASGVLHFRELQLWVNGVNVLPSYTIPTSASNNTSTNVAGNELGETIEFFDDGTTRSRLPVGYITYRASNIANEIIDIDEGYDCVRDRDSSLYIFTIGLILYKKERLGLILNNTTETLSLI